MSSKQSKHITALLSSEQSLQIIPPSFLNNLVQNNFLFVSFDSKYVKRD